MLLTRQDHASYPFVQLENNEFKFITQNTNEYIVGFGDYWQQDVVDLYGNLDMPVHEFYFEVQLKKRMGFDNRIAFTIFDIVELFLRSTGGATYYVTQREDGRSRELFKVYQMWHRLYNRSRGEAAANMMKVDRIVLYEETPEAYLSCLTLRQNLPAGASLDQTIDCVLAEIYPNCMVRPF